MSCNEAETRFHLIDPVLRRKGYDDHQWLKLETPAPVEPTGAKGRRRRGRGRTDYLLCVQADGMPKSLPVAVLEAKRESEDPPRPCNSRSKPRKRQRVTPRPEPISLMLPSTI